MTKRWDWVHSELRWTIGGIILATYVISFIAFYLALACWLDDDEVIW